MKQLIFCLMLFCFGCHGLVFSQDYVQTQKMLEAKYSYVSLDKENNCFEVELNGKKGICDLRGKEIIAPDKYTYIYTYGVKDGYYKVKIGDKTGLCDLTGKEIIPCKYDGVVLLGTYYGVSLNNKEGACDLSGKEIVPCEYDDLIYSDGFKYQNSGGGWELIVEVPRLAEHDKVAASASGSLSETKTSTATIPSTANASAETQAEAIHTEDKPLFFLNKTYVLQSNDYSKMHMVSFYGKNDFIYMVFDGQTQTEIGRQYGEFTYENGHIKIAFKDNSVSEFDIKMINSNKVSFQFVGTTTPQIYAVALSADDLFSVNLAHYWGSHNSSPQSTYQPYQQPQQHNQQKVTQRVVCTSCNGTGKTCILKTVPTYGTHSNVKHRCTTCNELLSHGSVHVQQRCSRCQGTGYIER